MPGGILPPISVEGSWPTPNYVNPIQRNWDLVIVAVFLSVTSSFVVCARLWARFKLGSVGIDDVIIIVTMVRITPPINPLYDDENLTAKAHSDSHVGLDMSPSVLFSTAAYIALTTTVSRRYGFDRHIWDVPVPVGIMGRKVDCSTPTFSSFAN
jgi:hypothetical protein